IVVRFFPLATTQFARARACSTVIGVSTRTASRSPEISVDEIGGHGRSFSPGATSLATAGMPGARKTSHRRGVFCAVRPELAVLLSDCPCIERASSARIGQREAVTRPIPRASDRNSRLEGIVAFWDRMSCSFCEATALPHVSDKTTPDTPDPHQKWKTVRRASQPPVDGRRPYRAVTNSTPLAAFSISDATAWGCERKMEWLPLTSTTVEPARFDM